MQEHQLKHLDTVIRQEIDTTQVRVNTTSSISSSRPRHTIIAHYAQGAVEFMNRAYRVLSNRSVFDFVTEVMVVQHVMDQRGISHET